jgi:hypothetical protein
MGQGRQIAARTDRSFLWHHGMHPAIEHFAKHLDDLHPNPAEAEREHICAQQHHRAHFGLGKRIANAAGVTPNEIELQFTDLIVWNPDIRKFAKACAHAVNDGVARDNIFDDFSRSEHARARFGSEFDLFATERDRGNLLKRKWLAVKLHRGMIARNAHSRKLSELTRENFWSSRTKAFGFKR